VNDGKIGRHTRPKSQAQIERRRERNKILARRTRLRKKFFFESLQKEVCDLQAENLALKALIRLHLDSDSSKKILDENKASEQLSDAVLEQCGLATNLDKQDFNLVQSLKNSQKCMIITDPSLEDNPIVFASDSFTELTGFSKDDILGRNCRFLQGPETDASKIAKLRSAIKTGEDICVTMINYKADGTAFWNNLFVAALRDAENNVVNYIGVLVEVQGPEPGDPEHGKALPEKNM
jgi:PAS domain S-box-containing protein